jgi:hypothetical protein
MSKNRKIILFAIISLTIFLILAIFLCPKLVKIIFAPKHYIHFENLDKVEVCYKSDGFGSTGNSNVITYEVEVTDKEFLNLIETTYKDKIINDYNTNLVRKGAYKIVINETIELCIDDDGEEFCLDYNGKWYKVKPNMEIYKKVISIIENELNSSKN